MSKRYTTPRKLEAYQLIIRATWHGGNFTDRDACVSELHRRGGWLTDEQKRQAGYTPESYRAHWLAWSSGEKP